MHLETKTSLISRIRQALPVTALLLALPALQLADLTPFEAARDSVFGLYGQPGLIAAERTGAIVGLEILATMVSCLLLVAVSIEDASKSLLLSLLSILGILFGGAYLLCEHFGFLLDASFPAFSAILVGLVLGSARHARAELHREHVTNVFKNYVPPDLVDRLTNANTRIAVGGDTREITVLFADVEGFTALSEQLKKTPQRLTAIVNMLLERMSDAVLAEGGTIDKFMGDNVMAFWNAPMETPDHAACACRAAVGMQRAISALNLELWNDPAWADVVSSHRPLSAGIGIATGICVVGNFGSKHRVDYSAIGDTVNLASRLEGAAKRYGIAALASAATARGSHDIGALPLGHIRVRGRKEAPEAFAIVDVALDHAPLLRAHTAFMAAKDQKDREAASSEALAFEPSLERLYEGLLKDREQRAAAGGNTRAD